MPAPATRSALPGAGERAGPAVAQSGPAKASYAPAMTRPGLAARSRPISRLGSPDRLPASHHVPPPGPAMSVSCREEGGCLVAALTGTLDGASAPALREYLLRLVHHGSGRLVIDLSAVSHADAGGLSVLVGTGRRARLLGGSLRLAGPAPQVLQMLTTTGLDRQLDIYATAEAAMSVQAPA